MTTILVVEDEAVVAADIAQRLKRSGYDVPAVAATGKAALRMTEELHPDLILMDILIKGEKDGIETAREIKDRFEIPLIFLTGQADESTVKRVRDTGHYGFLLKPIDTASLLPTVEMALIKHAYDMQLKESENRLRTLIDSAVDAIFSIDAQGNVTDWNKAAERTFGWTADDITGQSVTAILPESSKAGFVKILPMLSTYGTYVPPSFQLWRRKDGTEFPGEPSFASWKTKEGMFATAIVRDISKRKQAEAEHQRLSDDYERQARMLDGMLSASAEPIFLLDPDGRFLYQNEASARAMGAKKGGAIGKTMRELGLPADIAKQAEVRLESVFATGQAQAGTVDYSFPDGIRHFEYVVSPVFDPHGDIEGVVVSDHDVTEQKRMQAAIAESEAQQKAILESVQTGIMLVDSTTHKIVDVNTTAAQLFGAPKEAIIGSVCNRFICPAEVGRCPITDLGQTVDNAERVLLTADGKSRPILKSVSEITLGGRAYLLESFIDISDRKQMERALLESEAYYRAIFESTATGMAIVEEDMTVAMVNGILEHLTGYSKNEVEGLKPWTDFVAPEDLELMKTYHRTRRRDDGSAPKGYEFRLLTKDGTRREAFLTVALIPGTRRSVVSIVDLTALKTAQEAVRKQAGMLDAAHDAIMTLDPEGTITYWNRGAERLYGWTKQEVTGQNANALLITTFPESREALWPKLMESGLWEGELIHVTRDGIPITVASSWTLMKDERGNASAILEISSDITERKKAELALADSEAKLRITFASMTDGIVLNGLDRKVTDCNEAVLRLTQRSREEIIGKPFTDLLAPEFRSQILETIPELLEKGAIRTNSKMLRKNGESFDVESNVSLIKDAAGQPTAFLTVIRDVTERKKAESVLQEAQEELKSVNDELRTMNETLEKRVQERTERLRVTSLYARSLIEASLDPLVTISTEGKITDVNAATEEVTGCTRDELIGSDFSDFFTEPAKANAGYQRVFNEGSIRDYPLAIRHRSGGVSDVLYNATVFRNDAGEIQGVFASARDISALKQLEQVLRESKLLEKRTAELARSNAELEQFAYIASHDLQEPLRMITSYLQIIEEDYKGKLDEDADEYIGFAVDGAKRMQTLINDLLKYSRVGTKGKSFVPISTETTLSEALDNMKVTIDETKAVITHDQLPTVLGDDAQLTQVFQNLLSNAIKFRGNSAPQIHVGVEQTPKEWVFSVRDNGIGIDMKYAERIFTIFQRLHAREEYPGTGIGLAVVKKIVERHGGRIWVESPPESGSTFYFTLPTTGGSVRYEQTK